MYLLEADKSRNLYHSLDSYLPYLNNEVQKFLILIRPQEIKLRSTEKEVFP